MSGMQHVWQSIAAQDWLSLYDFTIDRQSLDSHSCGYGIQPLAIPPYPEDGERAANTGTVA
jgi:hypothetical protein